MFLLWVWKYVYITYPESIIENRQIYCYGVWQILQSESNFWKWWESSEPLTAEADKCHVMNWDVKGPHFEHIFLLNPFHSRLVVFASREPVVTQIVAAWIKKAMKDEITGVPQP